MQTRTIARFSASCESAFAELLTLRDAIGWPQINTGKETSGMTIYHHFLERGLTDSRRHFSSAWLCRAENYLALRSGREASADALVELFQTLWREGRLILAARVAWAVLWLPEGARR
ncbi:DUF6626 family protein [Brevundimonas sp.]|uniref:DUF6626 family protein n=1 Tax=Brevundimonas sp. TaxID=1871086 RepID=UPI0025B7EF03|nr:DUF6626 family protein [Brevundimonas sp.]